MNNSSSSTTIPQSSSYTINNNNDVGTEEMSSIQKRERNRLAVQKCRANKKMRMEAAIAAGDAVHAMTLLSTSTNTPTLPSSHTSASITPSISSLSHHSTFPSFSPGAAAVTPATPAINPSIPTSFTSSNTSNTVSTSTSRSSSLPVSHFPPIPTFNYPSFTSPAAASSSSTPFIPLPRSLASTSRSNSTYPLFQTQSSTLTSSSSSSSSSSIDDLAKKLSQEGYIITDYNHGLFCFIQGFKSTLRDQMDRYFKPEVDLIGDQDQYQMFEKKGNKFINDITPCIPNELAIIGSYFKMIGDETYMVTDVKLTTNVKECGEVEECLEQTPHTDVSTNTIVFLTIPASEIVTATRIYGTKERLLELTTSDEIIKFFNIKDQIVKQGQCLLFLPSYVHGSPKLASIPQPLIYIEWTTFLDANTEFTQTLIDEFSDNEMYQEVIQSLSINKNWAKLPLSPKQKEN